MSMLEARVQPNSIPLSMGFDQARLDRLKGADPLEIVVQVEPGRGSHGTYSDNAIKRFVSKVQLDTLAGYLGHSKPEDFSFEWRAPAVHWIGAAWDGVRGLFRGVVDAGMPDLKRLIREGRIDAVSIHYGDARRERRGGETYITDLTPFSIDVAPRDRAGQAGSRIVGMGELDGKSGTREVLGELVSASHVGLVPVWVDVGGRRTPVHQQPAPVASGLIPRWGPPIDGSSTSRVPAGELSDPSRPTSASAPAGLKPRWGPPI